MKQGRNDPCACGSGSKYKKCCLKKEQAAKDEPKVVYVSEPPRRRSHTSLHMATIMAALAMGMSGRD